MIKYLLSVYILFDCGYFLNLIKLFKRAKSAMFTEIEQLFTRLSDNSNLESLSDDDFKEWLAHPITKAFHNDVKIYMLESMNTLAEATPHDEKARTEETLIRGELNALRWVLQYETDL